MVAAVVSAVWLIAAPDYEPLVTLVAGIIGILTSLPSRAASTDDVEVPGGDEAIETEPFESELWPEEGVPVFRATTSHLTLHARPYHEAPVVAELDVEPGSLIQFRSFRYRTVRPGKVVAKKAGRLTGRNLGRINYLSRDTYYEDTSQPVELAYEPGDTFEYIQYRAEGSCFIRHGGYVFDIDYCPWLGGSEELALTKQPYAESWLHVTGRNEKPVGWLCHQRGVADEVDRSF